MDKSRPSSTSELVVTKKAPTTFLSLPVELRMIIYKLHLPATTNIALCSHPHTPKADLGTNILYTCRQVYLEASQYAYGNRLFKYRCPSGICTRNLTLNDSKFLQHLTNSTVDKIQRLELAVHIDCLYSYRASVSSYRAARYITPYVRLANIAKMQSLKYLCIKVVLVNFVCCVPAHAIKHAVDRFDYLGLDNLMVQVYNTIPTRTEVRWEAEIAVKGMPKWELKQTTEAATESIQKLAKRYQVPP
ncbi:hypothetical protein KCU95_g6835, partial [Aureobasidium melanogenum]